MSLSWQKIDALATLLGCKSSVSEYRALLKDLQPPDRVARSSNTGGAFWIGLSFAAGESPQLRVYTDCGWGSETQNWSRMDLCASYIRVDYEWALIKGILAGRMRPLGLSMTFARGKPLAMRFYVRAYGNPVSYYAQVAHEAVCAMFGESLIRFAKVLLRDEWIYPCRSVVCSFGFPGPDRDFKCEFCGHCIFSSDAEAVDRCADWLSADAAHSACYLAMLHILTGGRISASDRGLHSFVGLGSKLQQSYGTLYFNPGASGSCAK